MFRKVMSIVILFFGLFCIPVLGFASGAGESPQDPSQTQSFATETSGYNYNIAADLQAGNIIGILRWKHFMDLNPVGKVVVKITLNSDPNNPVYYPAKPNSGVPTELKMLNTLNSTAMPEKKIDTKNFSASMFEADTPYKVSNLMSGTVNGEKLAMTGVNSIFSVPASELRVPISFFSQPAQISILLIRNDGQYERLRCDANLEFFAGERKLFWGANQNTSNLLYQQKALAFISTLFLSTDKRDEFITEAGKIFNTQGIDWNQFDNASNLSDYQKSFRRVFSRHFFDMQHRDKYQYSNWSVMIQYLTTDYNSFDALYKSSGSIYIKSFLKFIKSLSKPALSAVINSNIFSIDSAYAYDYGNYQLVNVDQGSQIATGALRYLTWGVEYTLPTDRINMARTAPNPIMASHKDLVTSWISVGGLSNTSNYLQVNEVAIPNLPAQSLESKVTLTTPYKIGAQITRGNPIPYSEKGVDSPRTFAYKMYEQMRARTWIKKYTRPNAVESLQAYADDMNWQDGYVNEITIAEFLKKKIDQDAVYYKGNYDPDSKLLAIDEKNQTVLPYKTGDLVIKPFLPGAPNINAQGDNNQKSGRYNTDKMAGVDSLGILSGSIAMTDFFNRVIDSKNRALLKDLDLYFHMTGSPLGVDAEHDPIFYAAPNGPRSILKGQYRFNRIDIERTTVLISELQSAQKGDIIVRMDDPTNKKADPQIGIIVGFTTQGAHTERNQFIIVSTTASAKAAFLKTWDDKDFFDTPERFQIRRLLITKASDTDLSNRYKPDTWELLDNSLASLDVHVLYKEDNDKEKDVGFIPNTGEYLKIPKIEIKKIDLSGTTSQFTMKENRCISILAPIDRGYSATENNDSNIYNNKGDGIEFAVVDGNSYTKLATFSRSQISGSNKYTVVYEPAYFDSYGRAKKPRHSLTVDNTMRLSFDGKTQFAVRPINAGPNSKIRPGDDFLLQFGLYDPDQDPSSNNSLSTLVSGATGEKNYCAVYDKKLLWRANLYIDEGANDWNKLHPWNAPPNLAAWVGMLPIEKAKLGWWSSDWGYNEWNKDANNVPSNGRQVISIKPWTHWNDNSTVLNTAAYGWGCWDDAPDFNNYMTREASIIADARVNAGGNDFYAGAAYVAKAWVDDTNHRTLAPGNNWFNYVFRGRKMSSGGGFDYYDYSTKVDNYPAGITAQFEYITPDNYSPKPVIPGLSTWHAFGGPNSRRTLLPNDDPNQAGSYHSNQTATTTGVDCSGFVSKSANWNMRFGTDKQNTVMLAEGDSWLIQDRDLSNDPDLPNLKYAVPGDILDWVEGGDGQHVVIIQSITPDANGNVTKRGQIQIIQAGAGSAAQYQVMSNQVWGAGVGLVEYKKYKVYRLK